MKKYILLMAVFSSTFAKAMDFSCKDAQIFILNLPNDSLKNLKVDDQKIVDLGDFLESKPSLNGSSISTTYFVSTSGPYEQLWCKLKAQEAVAKSLKIPNDSMGKPCSDLHQHIFSLALESLIVDKTTRPSLSDLGIYFLQDQNAVGGFDWAPSQVKFESKSDSIGVRAIRLKTPLWAGPIGGMNYCKVLSLAGAKDLLRTRLEI
jgi:hypothetical protein